MSDHQAKPIRLASRLAEKATHLVLRALGAKAVWRANLHSEVAFWDDYFATKGGEWPEYYSERLDPKSELSPGIGRFLPADDRPVDILDVGAGPLTVLGKTWKGRALRIVAVDPLADRYDEILRKHGVAPVVRTIRGDAERLSRQFGRDAFDLVYARNCIDHAYSPENAILEMLKVVRRDGTIALMHLIDEAKRAQYQGLHQWNLSARDGDFIISSRTAAVNFTEKYNSICRVSCTTHDDTWVEAIIQRRE